MEHFWAVTSSPKGCWVLWLEDVELKYTDYEWMLKIMYLQYLKIHTTIYKWYVYLGFHGNETLLICVCVLNNWRPSNFMYVKSRDTWKGALEKRLFWKITHFALALTGCSLNVPFRFSSSGFKDNLWGHTFLVINPPLFVMFKFRPFKV